MYNTPMTVSTSLVLLMMTHRPRGSVAVCRRTMAAISYLMLSTLKRACARGTAGPLPVMRAADALYPPSCRRCALTRMRGQLIVFSPVPVPSGRLMITA